MVPLTCNGYIFSGRTYHRFLEWCESTRRLDGHPSFFDRNS